MEILLAKEGDNSHGFNGTIDESSVTVINYWGYKLCIPSLGVLEANEGVFPGLGC